MKWWFIILWAAMAAIAIGVSLGTVAARADDYGARIVQEHQCRQWTLLAKAVLMFKDHMHWSEARTQQWASSLAYGPGGVAYRDSATADAQLTAMVHEVYTGPWDVRNLGDYAFARCMGYAR